MTYRRLVVLCVPVRTAEVDGDEPSLHWSIANENCSDWGTGCPLSERKGKKEEGEKKSMNVWIFWTQLHIFRFKLRGVKRHIIGRKDIQHVHRPAVSYCALFSAGLKRFGTIPHWESRSSLPWNKHENYYHENHSSCVPHANNLPWTHVNTSWIKHSVDSQCVRTAEREASVGALWPQMQENHYVQKIHLPCLWVLIIQHAFDLM